MTAWKVTPRNLIAINVYAMKTHGLALTLNAHPRHHQPNPIKRLNVSYIHEMLVRMREFNV